jgi:hypothetical protein
MNLLTCKIITIVLIASRTRDRCDKKKAGADPFIGLKKQLHIPWRRWWTEMI